MTAAMLEVTEEEMSRLLALALARHQQGQLDEAERGYQAVLSARPRHAQALHLLGIVALHQGRAECAAQLITVSLEIEPREPLAHLNLAAALRSAGRAGEAQGSLERSLELAPDYADAWNNLGDLLLEMDKPEQALASLERALQLVPEFPIALNNRGNALLRLGRAEEALVSCERALRLEPGFVTALNNRGNALRELGRLESALASFDEALRLRPGYATAIYNRANALLELKRYDEAFSAYDRALQARADDSAALSGRAVALLHLGRLDDSLACSQRACALSSSPLVLSNHGSILMQLHRFEEALLSIERALQLQPLHVDALNNHGSCLTMLKRFGEATRSFERLLAIAPTCRYGLGRLVYAQLCGCDWDGLAARNEQLLSAVEAGEPVIEPARLLTLPSTPAQQLRCARTYVEREYRHATGTQRRRPGLPHQRIRVAYLSGDLREHAVSTLIVGVFEQHDRAHFEVLGVSLRPQDASPLGQRVWGALDRCVDVSRRSDADVARWLREQEVDIAVDLSGFTYGGRLGILAQRPAPVQVNYLGYAGTLGAPYIDYLIADANVIPRGEEHGYQERIVRLPHCYLPTDSKREIAEQVPSRIQEGLPQGFVFASFANSYKITPAIFDVWMRLLRAVPGSVLWLRSETDEIRENLRREAASRGVSAERLLFAAHVASAAQHLARHGLIDLMLDTIPYGAHSTACDALWVGTPLLTCAGNSFPGRVGMSALRAAGLPELQTHSLEEYEALALALARSPERLAAARERLGRQRASAPLFDTARYTRGLERAYQSMYERAVRGLPPQGFDLDEEA
jgi:protein O-GlcNAc transferase